MPKPQNKAELIAASHKERQALEEFLSTLTAEQKTQPGIVGHWSVKDMLAHLIEWEQMVLGWLAAGEAGQKPHVPAEGYKWSQIPALNEAIRQKYQARPLDEIEGLFSESYRQTMAAIERLSEESLFTPGLYPWMNKNTLAAYFTSCTGSHYRWARKELRKGFRAKN